MKTKQGNSVVYCFRASGELHEALQAAIAARPDLPESDVLRLACATGLARVDQLDEAFKRQAIDNGIALGISTLVKNIQEITAQITQKARE